MTYKEIGRRLGMHHEVVRIYERRALNKLRAALEGAPVPEVRIYRCGNCGELGHGRRTCER